MEKDEDPQASIMNMMKQMVCLLLIINIFTNMYRNNSLLSFRFQYEDGDDEMKRTIAKVFDLIFLHVFFLFIIFLIFVIKLPLGMDGGSGQEGGAVKKENLLPVFTFLKKLEII